MKMEYPSKYSTDHLLPELDLDTEKWNQIPEEQVIAATVKAIEEGGIEVIRLRDGNQALAKIKELIPPGSEVMNGYSTTLIEIGFQELMDSGEHEWKDMKRMVTGENDAQERAKIRRKTVTSDFFLSGVNAIAMTGELVGCDATGSRVGAWPYGAGNLLLVAGTNKIVPSLDDALRRIREYTFPLEDLRSRNVYGVPSKIGKCVILANESQPGRVTLLLIDESRGY
ncbi:lactate utilization protein [Methanothrix sp.]|uniref:lactate utilization protein n=1 Tax=Methanothrix sp. TaxID=90426 RepID=UPI003296D4C9